MHACGHDTHVAMLAGRPRAARRPPRRLAGRVLFMFQPGEEGYHGARYMLEEGLLDDARPRQPVTRRLRAAHHLDRARRARSTSRPGTMMASSDSCASSCAGRGGHASAPHHALDPIPVACEIVQALQTMVTRRIDVFDPAVVTVAHIKAGTTTNVIPETAGS